MALETFDYPDGTTSIPEATVYEGSFETQSERLVPTTARTRIAWPSQREGRWSISIDPSGSDTGNAGIIVRASDVNNYLSFHFRSQDGLVRGSKYVNGINTAVLETDTFGYGQGEARTLSVEIIGDTVKVYINESLRGTWVDDSGLTGSDAGLRTDSTSYTFDNFYYQSSPLPTSVPVPTYTQSGKAWSATKIGEVLGIHSAIIANGDTDEFFLRVVDGRDIPNWPYQKYPLVLYSSSDHTGGGGGIYVRAFDPSLGGISDDAAWPEYQNISNQTEFDHITKKTCPIYVDNEFIQTETPTVKVIDGTVYMYYHTNGVFQSGYSINVQNTHLATSVNGIDFGRVKSSAITYNPQYESGNGHTGYADIIENPIAKWPYSYLLISSHGGGTIEQSPAQGIWGTNDLENMEIIKTIGRATDSSALSNLPTIFDNVTPVLMPHNVSTMQKEGAYWRMAFNIRKDIVTGGDNAPYIPVEILVDDDFNVVSKPNFYTSLGSSGEFDEDEMNHPFQFEYNGQKYAFYKGVAADESVGMGLLQIDEVDYDWEVIRSLADEQQLQIHDALDYSNLSTTTALSDTAGLVQMALPANGDAAILSAPDVNLDTNDVTEFRLRRHGRVTNEDIGGFVGLVDNPANPQNGIILKWPYNADGVNVLKSALLQDGQEIAFSTRKTVGRNIAGGLDDNLEDPKSRQNYAIRVSKSDRKFYILDGSAIIHEQDIWALDLNQNFTPTISFSTNDGVAALTEFESMEVISYSNDERGANQPPTANAGADQSVAAGATFTLDGSASTDTDGTIVEYRWTQPAGDTVALDLTDPIRPVGVAPNTANAQTLTFSLITVDDQNAESVADTVDINVAAEVEEEISELDDTVSYIKVRSGPGTINDTNIQPIHLYQYSDNFILCHVVNERDEVLDPGLFYDAEYRITDTKGAEVFTAKLYGKVNIVDDCFLIHIDDDVLNKDHKGTFKHQFVVWNEARFKLPPIFGGNVNIIPVLEPSL